MKRVLMLFFTLLAATACLAAARRSNPDVVQWQNVVGVITAPGVNVPAGQLQSGTAPWHVRRGRARVNLATGATSFEVEGLVLMAGTATGTAGPISAVVGTLVCSAGQLTETAYNTAAVRLSSDGDAEFSGHLQGVPGSCARPIFLIRVSQVSGAVGGWIAAAVERVGGDDE